MASISHPVENHRIGSLYHIPAQIYEDENLSGEDVLLYALLAALADNLGYCYASNDWLAKKRKTSEESVKRRLASLENRGYIKRETNKNGMYWERKIFISHSRVSNNVCEGSNLTPPKGQICADRRVKSDPIVREEDIVRESLLSEVPSDEKKISFSKESYELAELLLNKILEYHPGHKRPNLTQWAKDIEDAHRLDGRSWKDLRDVILWAQADSFWRANVQSGSKLRRQYDTLWIKMTSSIDPRTQVSSDTYSFSIGIIKKSRTLEKMLEMGKIAFFGDKIVVYGGQSQKEFGFKEPNFKERFEEYTKKIIESGVKL